MTHAFLGDGPSVVDSRRTDTIALALRTGLGSVFLIGGWWKLSRALDPERADALVTRYMAGDGYINAFFAQYLFEGPAGVVLSPLVFLTLLSSFELIAGAALIAGLFVRALSFVYAFLIWSFIFALPVMTTPGVVVEGKAITSPALLVQARDIGLSGMFFVLLNLGSGPMSLDRQWFGHGFAPARVNWDAYGLLLRLSVAIVFLVGGFFAGLDHIKSFVPAPLLLIAIGLALASGHGVRVAAAAAGAVVLWYSVGKLSFDATLWNNLNAIKRELAYLAACGVMIAYQGGRAYRLSDLFRTPAAAVLGAGRPASG